jgi:hydroxyacylglutathione hydrolase
MNNDEKIQIRQFRYFSDNFGYLVFGEKTAMAIDGGAAEKILDFVREDEKKWICF